MKKERIKKRTDAREQVGKVFTNLGQIVFATMFLGGVLGGQIPHYVIALTGGIGAILLLFFGVRLSIKEKED